MLLLRHIVCVEQERWRGGRARPVPLLVIVRDALPHRWRGSTKSGKARVGRRVCEPFSAVIPATSQSVTTRDWIPLCDPQPQKKKDPEVSSSFVHHVHAVEDK